MSKNVIALLVVIGLFALVGALAYRPAAFIGVQPGALAHSVGDEDDPPFPENCLQRDDDVWSCRIYVKGIKAPVGFAVETRSLGCWDAWRGRKAPGSAEDADRSGCINGLDFAFGD